MKARKARSATRKTEQARRAKGVRKVFRPVPRGIMPVLGERNGELVEMFMLSRQDLGRFIRVTRWSRRWTRSHLCFRTGLTYAQVQELEEGAGDVGLAALVRVAFGFGGLTFRLERVKAEEKA